MGVSPVGSGTEKTGETPIPLFWPHADTVLPAQVTFGTKTPGIAAGFCINANNAFTLCNPPNTMILALLFYKFRRRLILPDRAVCRD